MSASILKKAQEKKLIEVGLVDIRDFALGKHRIVDDRPYGGGPGMVLKAEPVVKAIRSVKREHSHVVYLSPQGTPLSAAKAEELSKHKHLILLCGHYEGVDSRAVELEVDEEVSIGDYILTSGCIPSLVLVDAVSRFVPGVLGNEESALVDSFQDGYFKGPIYTRPEVFEGKSVPQELLTGNHAEIDAWRKKQGRLKTARVRKDLIVKEKI